MDKENYFYVCTEGRKVPPFHREEGGGPIKNFPLWGKSVKKVPVCKSLKALEGVPFPKIQEVGRGQI